VSTLEVSSFDELLFQASQASFR